MNIIGLQYHKPTRSHRVLYVADAHPHDPVAFYQHGITEIRSLSKPSVGSAVNPAQLLEDWERRV